MRYRAVEVIRVDAESEVSARNFGLGIRGVSMPERHGFVGDGSGDGDFVDAVFGERDADGVAEAVEEEVSRCRWRS